MKTIKCLLILSFVSFFSLSLVSARSFNTEPCYNWNWQYDTNGRWSFVSRWENDWIYNLNYNPDWIYVFRYSNETWWLLTQLDSWNAWDYFSCNFTYYMSYITWRVYSNYNFIQIYKNTDPSWWRSWTFKWWNEKSRSYRSFDTAFWWYTDDDWVLFDMYFPYHWTIVLYSSATRRTIQFIGNHVIRDKIIYVDPTDNDQNMYVIDMPNLKAWSLHLQSDFRYYFFWMWDLDDTMLSELDFEQSYDILTWQWQHFFPDTNIQFDQSNSMNSSHPYAFLTDNVKMWLTMLYQTDIEYVPPYFQEWWNTDYWSWQWVSSDMIAWNNYQQCERETSFKNFIVNAWGMCRDDYKNWSQDYTWFRAVNDFIQQWNIWNENLTWELEEYFSWIDLSYWCNALLNNSIALVKLYNLTWKDPEYYFNVINTLKYITNDNPYDISQQCWNRPSVPTEYQPITNSSNVCNMDSRSNIVNCFNFWSSDTWSWSSYFDVAIDNIKSMVWNAFDSNFLLPIKTSFNEWNSLLSRNWVWCDNDTLLQIPYIDYVLWTIVILIFFLLFSMI